jgi:hypothetical protein
MLKMKVKIVASKLITSKNLMSVVSAIYSANVNKSFFIFQFHLFGVKG